MKPHAPFPFLVLPLALLGGSFLFLAGCQEQGDQAQMQEIRQQIASMRADLRALQEEVASLRSATPAAEPTPAPAAVAPENENTKPAPEAPPVAAAAPDATDNTPAEPKPADATPGAPAKAVWDGYRFIVKDNGEERPLEIGLADFKPGGEVVEGDKTFVLPQRVVVTVRVATDGTYADPVSGKRFIASRADIVRGSFQHPQVPGVYVRMLGSAQRVSPPIALPPALRSDFRLPRGVTMVHTGGEWWSAQPCATYAEAKAVCDSVMANPPAQARELIRMGYRFTVSRDGYIFFARP